MGDFVLNTDFSTIEPDVGGGTRRHFPVSDSKGWLVVMLNAEPTETNNKDGAFLAIELGGMEGVVQNKIADWSITTSNKNTQAVEIGRKQLSAVAHCIGHLKVGRISELYNKPFRVVVVLDTQKPETQEKYPGSTRISAILDIHGNKATEAGQGALQTGQGGNFGGGGQTQQQQQNFDQSQNNGGGFGGGGNGGGNFGGGNQGQDQSGSGNQGGGFGNNGGGNGVQQFNPNQNQNQNQNQQQQNNNGNFQQNGGGNGGGGNFQQQGNNGGGAGPGWGQG